MFCRRKILGRMNQLWANEEFTNGRTLLAAGRASKAPLLLGLLSSMGKWPRELVGMGGNGWQGIRLRWLGASPEVTQKAQRESVNSGLLVNHLRRAF